MTQLSRRAALALPALVLPLAVGRGAGAQAAWPSRAIRMIVPFPAGGATDLTARVVSERLSAALGQPVVIDNRPGAGGNLGCEMAAKAEPDGYTLLTCTIGTASINQYLYTRLPYDPSRDLANVALINEVANGLFVPVSSPHRTLGDLIAAAKARPGALTYGTPGNGTSGHLCGEYLKSRAAMDLTHVPYRGTSQIIPDVLAGRVDVAVDNLPGYVPHLRDGRMRCLAVTTASRWFSLPEVPTVAESGVPGFEAAAWFGFQAPARVPRPVVERLAGLVTGIVAEPATAERLREIGSAPRPLGPAEFDRYVAAENEKWREVVRLAGARLD